MKVSDLSDTYAWARRVQDRWVLIADKVWVNEWTRSNDKILHCETKGTRFVGHPEMR